jgi:predicted protein tyrosine phosphatase
MPRAQAEKHVPDGYEACISIGSPGQQPANLSSRFRAVLWLNFHDLAGFEREDGTYPDGAVQLTEDDADLIAAFALEHRGADLMVVHCEAGISRSVAVGLALSTTLGRCWAWPSYMPREYREKRHIHNRHVFDLVIAALKRAEVGVHSGSARTTGVPETNRPAAASGTRDGAEQQDGANT